MLGGSRAHKQGHDLDARRAGTGRTDPVGVLPTRRRAIDRVIPTKELLSAHDATHHPACHNP